MPEKEPFNGERTASYRVLELGRGRGVEERGELFRAYIDEIIKRVSERDKDIFYIPLLDKGLKHFHAHNEGETSRQTFKFKRSHEKYYINE